MNREGCLAFLLSAGVGFATTCPASDWPQFLGPTRNGFYPGNDLAADWPAAGPAVAWKKPVGHGWSGPVVAQRRVVLCHRQGDQELVACFDAGSGDSVWTFTYPATYQDDFGFDDGPRATPAIADGRVYTLSPDGLLHCLEFGTGKKVWSVDLKAEYGSQKGFFGMACSPLVEGDAVLLNIGGSKGAGVVALNRTDGKLLWKTSNDDASYSSPVVATRAGKRQALFLTREGLLALEPSTGVVQFQFPWHSRNRMSVNAATPIIVGDSIFISASYGTGAALLRPRETGIETIWSGDDLLSNHYATSVEVDGFLYGIHGRTDPGFSPRPQLRCVDVKNHKVCWQTDAVGAATLTRAGNRLFILTEKGELIAAAASAERFVVNQRATVSPSEVRAFPAVADGFFYFRSKDQLTCLDLRGLKPR